MTETIIVTGTRYARQTGAFYGGYADASSGLEPNPTLYPPGEGGGGGQGATVPTCENSNPVITDEPPADGASYHAPKNITVEYLNGALEHLRSTYNNNPFNKANVVAEFDRMYTDKSHPFFIDFKDWGTAAGPDGGVGAGTITYFSSALQKDITVNSFKPFGNYFYGLAGTVAGLSDIELYAATALVQENGSGFSDDPSDVPHVKSGIAAAQKYLALDQTKPVFGLDVDCVVK